MGRGHESEVRVNDISVSRCHAKIKYHPQGIFIEDNSSKFGTLVLLKEQFPLVKDHTYAFQIGRSVVSFSVRESMAYQNKVMKMAQEQLAVFMPASHFEALQPYAEDLPNARCNTGLPLVAVGIPSDEDDSLGSSNDKRQGGGAAGASENEEEAIEEDFEEENLL